MKPNFFAHRAFALSSVVVALTLAGCGSSVKLDETAVADRTPAVSTNTGSQSGSNSGQTGGNALGQRQVSSVDANASALGQPPANVARLVYFDYDDFTVKAEYAATLEGHARFLKADRARKVNLEGHADERGGREYNLALGQKRSEAVRKSLSLLGVSEAQMEAVSFGEEKPAAMGASEEAYRLNRRVELTYR
jgi:peptidoglycan-associated lipoprotein